LFNVSGVFANQKVAQHTFNYMDTGGAAATDSVPVERAVRGDMYNNLSQLCAPISRCSGRRWLDGTYFGNSHR
jgi:hypothetical protein